MSDLRLILQSEPGQWGGRRRQKNIRKMRKMRRESRGRGSIGYHRRSQKSRRILARRDRIRGEDRIDQQKRRPCCTHPTQVTLEPRHTKDKVVIAQVSGIESSVGFKYLIAASHHRNATVSRMCNDSPKTERTIERYTSEGHPLIMQSK